jgi:hypothetical protein
LTNIITTPSGVDLSSYSISTIMKSLWDSQQVSEKKKDILAIHCKNWLNTPTGFPEGDPLFL